MSEPISALEARKRQERCAAYQSLGPVFDWIREVADQGRGQLALSRDRQLTTHQVDLLRALGYQVGQNGDRAWVIMWEASGGVSS